MNTIKPFSRITGIFGKGGKGEKYICAGKKTSTDHQENIFMKFVNNPSFRSTKIHILRW